MTGKSLISDEYMSDIADSIRTKKGTVGTMKVYEMADEIASISGGGVELSTSLSTTSDKQSTSGAVTLTTELSSDEYTSVGGLNHYGWLNGATVSFYEMVGQSPNPLIDNLIGSSTTQDITVDNVVYHGRATCNTTITDDTSFYTRFNGNGGSFNSANSNIVNVEYDNWKDTYQPVEWIKSDGNQYIEINYKHKPNTICELVMSYNSYTSYNVLDGLLGSRTAYNNTDAFGIFINNEDIAFCIGGNVRFNFFDLPKDTENTLIISKNNIQLNGTNHTFTSNLTNAPSNWYIFCVREGSSYIDNISRMKLYNLKIYEGSTLMMDLKPCYHRTNGTIGLYDTVNSTFYDNDGTGTFTKGSDVND